MRKLLLALALVFLSTAASAQCNGQFTNGTICGVVSGGPKLPAKTAASGFLPSILPTPTRAGDVIYWNGSAWVTLAGNNSGTSALTEDSSGVPSWVGFSPAALTRTNDTNVTLTLGGTPTTALLQATSLTLGWTGSLSLARGGTAGTSQQTALNNVAPTPTRAGDLMYYNGTNWVAFAGNNSGTRFLTEDASGVPAWASAGAGVTSINLLNGVGMSIITTSGANPCVSTCALTLNVSLSILTNSLGADVNLNNTANYFDGPSVAQGTTGTWWAAGTVTINNTTTPALVFCKLWDGTTVIASSSAGVGIGSSNAYIPMALSGYLASPAGNIRISCRDSTSTAGKIYFNVTGNSKDSTISVQRIQ